MDIIEQYVTVFPSSQIALDIFKGEWSSQLPQASEPLQAGTALLFEDGRIEWAMSQFGNLTDKQVLELGPLEGGHTYMLEKAGATVTAIEANTRAYLKCLVTKEILGLQRSRFLCGDFLEFLRSKDQTFDVGIASGVLYHMKNPAELIALCAKATDQLFIWTHYYDAAILAANPQLQNRVSEGVPTTYEEFEHTLYLQQYGVALGWAGFCGAGAEFSNWMSQEDIIRCCKHFGFTKIETNFLQPDHPNGPSLALVAKR
jgi:Methyltransferase domain